MADVLNIGIPCYRDVNLDLYQMTLACSDNKVKCIDAERAMRKRAQDIINCELDNKYFLQQEYLPVLNYMTGANSVSRIDVSPRQRLETMFNIFGFSTEGLSSEDIKKNVYHKVNSLENYFGADYRVLASRFKSLLDRKPRNVDARQYLRSIYIYSRNVLEKSFILDDIDLGTVINPYLEYLNPDKLALYIAYKSLREAKDCLNRKDYFNAQRHLFYVKAYLDGDFNRRIVLDFYSFGQGYYKRDNLKKDYANILTANIFLKDAPSYDRDLFTGRSKEENDVVIDRILNVKKITTDEFFVKPGQGGHKRTNPDIRPKISDEERKAAQKFQLDRELFYYSKNPIAVIDCNYSFANYRGFLFKNGIVIADRVLNMNALSEIKKDAAYVLPANEFEDGIKLNKPTLRMLGYPFIVHGDNWKEEVDFHSKVETSDEVKEYGQTLALKRRI